MCMCVCYVYTGIQGGWTLVLWSWDYTVVTPTWVLRTNELRSSGGAAHTLSSPLVIL